MLFGFWSWVLVVIIVAVIFYANKLPQLKEQAEEKLKEGKVLLEKSKKDLEAKAIVLAEKAKDKAGKKELYEQMKKSSSVSGLQSWIFSNSANMMKQQENAR